MAGILGQVTFTDETQVFRAEWDEEGVFVYQAFNDEIADFALENQKFGGRSFKDSRMTWVKPSFGWVLYRSGYGRKANQNRILKVNCLVGFPQFFQIPKSTALSGSLELTAIHFHESSLSFVNSMGQLEVPQYLCLQVFFFRVFLSPRFQL